MTHGLRRRAVLAALAPLLLAQGPPLPAPPPAPPGSDAAAVVAQLRFARDMLCARCSDDIERSGVNHPARRSMIGRDKLETARDMIVAAPGLPGAVPALRQVLYGIEVLHGQDEEAATAAIDAAIRAIQAEARVAAGAPPDPRALIGQLRLARSFVCVWCVGSEWMRGQRARAAEELAVAQAMLAAAPRLRHAEAVRGQMVAAEQALAAADDRRADAALARAIGRLRPLPR